MQPFDTRSFVDCAYFLRGACNRGSLCPFKHDPVRCRSWQKPARRLARAACFCCKLTATVLTIGTCNPLTRPHMLHHLVQTKVNSINLREQQGQQDCIFFLQGRCSKGSLCPFRHDEVGAG